MGKYLVISMCILGVLWVLPNAGAQTDDRFTFRADSVAAPAGSMVELAMRLDITDGKDASAVAINGYEYSTCHNADIATPLSVDRGALHQLVNPTFWYVSMEADGYSVGATFGAGPGNWVPPGIGYVTEVVSYLLVGAEGRRTKVSFCSQGLTTGPRVTVLPATLNAVGIPGAIRIPVPGETTFVRGDCNDSGMFDLGDSLFILSLLFETSGTPHCSDACDTNNDDQIDLSDAIFGFGYLFSGQAAPPAPFPGCGSELDPSAGTLDCQLSAACL